MKPKIYYCTNTPAAPGREFLLFAGAPAFFCEVIKTRTTRPAPDATFTAWKGYYYYIEVKEVFGQKEKDITRITKKLLDWYLYNILMKG